MLQYKLQFPVTAYVKENGFLGIVSYDEYNDDLFVTTKSSPDGDFAKWFKELLYNTVDADTINSMKEYTKENNVSLVFECVDMKNDPHIIDYPTSQIFLLDIVCNDIEFKKYSYDDVCFVANGFGLKHKEKAYEIANWQDFFDWYYEVTDENYEYNGRNIEGFVIEDAVGYMVKLKLAYYNFWKFMRSISYEAIKKGYITRTSALTTPLANEYYSWVKELHNVEDKESIPKDICTLRNMFYDGLHK
jgi:tRNA splicing ligase